MKTTFPIQKIKLPYLDSTGVKYKERKDIPVSDARIVHIELQTDPGNIVSFGNAMIEFGKNLVHAQTF